MAIYEPVKIFDASRTISLEMDRSSYLVNRVKSRSVLHVGCSDYPITEERIESNNLLHDHLTRVTSQLLGIDNSIDGIKFLKEKGFDNVRLMDAEDITLNEKYDFIIAGDVLEHMNNPGKFLEKVGDLLSPEGRLIIGVPNAYSFNILKYIVSGYEPTHKDHTYYFSVKTLSELCSRYGLLPTKLIFSVQPTGQYGKAFLVNIRNVLVKLQKRLAPSIIMEFMQRENINTTRYFEWK